MADVVFRELPTEPEPGTMAKDLPEPKKDNTRVASGESDREPIEIRESGGGSVVLDALGIDDRAENLPEEDRENLQEVKSYVGEIIRSKGLSPTVGSFKKTLDGLKSEMGLSKESDPAIVLDRIAGVVKAWRNLSFVKDAEEKRQIFLKLASMDSSVKMNKEVFKIMEKFKIWE